MRCTMTVTSQNHSHLSEIADKRCSNQAAGPLAQVRCKAASMMKKAIFHAGGRSLTTRAPRWAEPSIAALHKIQLVKLPANHVQATSIQRPQKHRHPYQSLSRKAHSSQQISCDAEPFRIQWLAMLLNTLALTNDSFYSNQWIV